MTPIEQVIFSLLYFLVGVFLGTIYSITGHSAKIMGGAGMVPIILLFPTLPYTAAGGLVLWPAGIFIAALVFKKSRLTVDEAP